MNDERFSRSRRALLTALAGGTVGLAGCGGGADSTPTDGRTPTATGTPTETETAGVEPEENPAEIPPKEVGIPQWGRRLNTHARQAAVDWTQFEDEDITLTFGMALHPYTTTFSTTSDDGTALKDYFEELTGITVNYEIVSEDKFWAETEYALSSDDNPYDGVMVNTWPAGRYHYGDDGAPWVRDLQQYIDDDSLTDRSWLAMDDFSDQTLELLSFPDADGSQSLVGLPNTVEVFGCTAVHEPTFETVGLDHPTTFAELEAAARKIAESSEVDRDGIVSRTSSETLSSANWATMFKTHGAEWIDREDRTATLDSEQGVASLDRFGRMLHDYGPSNPSTYDWHAANYAYRTGDVGMLYASPQYSGIVDESVMAETTWLPPLDGPDGRSPVVNTAAWATGITQATDHPEAAWLYIQWANSRQANLMLSTRQWQGDDPRSGYARFEYIADQVAKGNAPPVLGEGYIDATRQALANVPGGDPDNPDEYPPVPMDTPQNMHIMREAAGELSSVVSGERTAQAALGDAALAIEDRGSLSRESIPERYVTGDRF